MLQSIDIVDRRNEVKVLMQSVSFKLRPKVHVPDKKNDTDQESSESPNIAAIGHYFTVLFQKVDHKDGSAKS